MPMSSKHFRLRNSPPAAGRICDMILFRRSAIPQRVLLDGEQSFLSSNKSVLHTLPRPNKLYRIAEQLPMLSKSTAAQNSRKFQTAVQTTSSSQRATLMSTTSSSQRATLMSTTSGALCEPLLCQTTQLFDFRKDSLHIRVRSWNHMLRYKLAKSLCIRCACFYG